MTCVFDECEEPAVAGVSAPTGLAERPAYVLIRRLTETEERGEWACLHHAHFLLDLTLLRQAAR